MHWLRRAILAIATTAVIVFAGWMSIDVGSPATIMVAGKIGALTFSSLAMVAAVVAGLADTGNRRRGWLWLAFGLAGWVIGDATLVYYAVVEHTRPPYPSVGDFAYLLLPLATVVGTVSAPWNNRSRTGIRLVLDGMIVASSLFLIAWVVVLHETWESLRASGTTFSVALAYPFTDLAMITIMAVLLAQVPKGGRATPTLLLTGLVIVGITDTVFVSMMAKGPVDDRLVTLGWTVGMFFVAAAALTSTTRRDADPQPPPAASRTAIWLPYVPVPFAAVFGATQLWKVDGAAPVLVTGLILILAALLRQFTLLDENQRLLVTVADLALRDPLTGLANRTLFSDRLAHAIALHERNATPLAVLLLDLDDFKLVNDSLGHPAGDELLRNVGDRIQAATRTGDTVARLGGDEFAVLIEDDPDIAHDVAEKVVAAFDAAFAIGEEQIFVRPSVGLAVADWAVDDELTGDELFRRADLAMYSAKRAHFSGVRTFTPDMQLDEAALPVLRNRSKSAAGAGATRMELLSDLRRAIDDRRLTLVYQPIFRLSSGAVAGVEALVRWPHPELGTLEPADFMPLVRQHGLMESLTDVVMRRAVEQAAGWRAAGTDIAVAINLSPPSFNDELPERIMSLLAEFDMPAGCLSVEITEDQLLDSLPRTRVVLDRMRSAGIRVALDDFGSGYSTMAYLRELPIDELKLDRQFIAPIMRDPRAAAIVRSAIDLAHTFGIASVAEGVENKATADRLREYRCEFVQGHYFSPPLPAQAIAKGIVGPEDLYDSSRATAEARPSSASAPADL